MLLRLDTLNECSLVPGAPASSSPLNRAATRPPPPSSVCGTEVLSNAIASQVALHASHGGVVPELAAREHLRHIVPVVPRRRQPRPMYRPRTTLTPSPSPRAPDSPVHCLSAFSMPGPSPSPLIKPLIAVNHLEGHIHAVLMQSLSEYRDRGTSRSTKVPASARRFRRPHAPVSNRPAPPDHRGMDLPQRRQHRRRCRRRSL